MGKEDQPARVHRPLRIHNYPFHYRAQVDQGAINFLTRLFCASPDNLLNKHDSGLPLTPNPLLRLPLTTSSRNAVHIIYW